MTITVFHKTGEIYFNHNGYEDYDGDEGYETEVDIPDSEVQEKIVELLIEYSVPVTITESERGHLKTVINSLIDGYDLFDKLCEDCADELREWAQRKYGNG